MWTLSGFSDEISSDLDEQIALVTDLGLRYIEFRSAWDTNVLDLDAGQLHRAKDALDAAGLQVSSIGSPVGKILITEDNTPHLKRAEHAIKVATFFGADYVRMFSYFIPEGDNPDDYRDEVIRRLKDIARIAEGTGITWLHENEKDIYGDIPRRCLDVVQSVNSPALRLTWDNANFVQCGVRPFTDGYALLRPYIEYVQIKDALFVDGTVVAAGEGDGQVRETIRALRDDGFDGFFSLEPHLGFGHALGGFSGVENWRRAHEAFTNLLTEEGITWA